MGIRSAGEQTLHTADSKAAMPEPHIYTIGHGGRSLDEVGSLLESMRVTYLIDVRSTPYSRYQPEFTDTSLKSRLSHGVLRYVFMGDLLGGRPREHDCYTGGKVDYGKLETKDFYLRGIARIELAMDKGLTVCLMCSEAHPAQCHRSKLIGSTLEKRGRGVLHVLPDGTIATQNEIMQEVFGLQQGLFEPSLTSRRVYRRGEEL